MEDVKKIKLFLDKRADGILQPDGTFANENNKDFFTSLLLTKTEKIIDGYVDISLDSTRESINRQLTNPFFIELGFFSRVDRIGEDTDTGGNLGSLKGAANSANITINNS